MLELPPDPKRKTQDIPPLSTTHHHQANIQFSFEYNLAPGVYLLEANEASARSPHLHRPLLKALTLVALYLQFCNLFLKEGPPNYINMRPHRAWI